MFFIIAGNSNLELFDSESGPDLTLSPQTFTSTAEAFINDNSDSLGVPGDNDMAGWKMGVQVMRLLLLCQGLSIRAQKNKVCENIYRRDEDLRIALPLNGVQNSESAILVYNV
ncbi:hypothetical protein PV325_007679 [Microctonus aethiopoides]|nr:hypothetical protein PV325_007679 [Microctonus aethiopoides]